MVKPLTDWHPKLAFKKCVQVGASTSVLAKVSYQACLKNISVIYTLPSTSDVRKFTAARLDPMIEGSPYLTAKMKPEGSALADSTEFKRIGQSFLYFKGSWAEHQAQSIDCDILCVDELDFSKPDIVEMYEERLEGSGSLGWEYLFSTPTVPGVGIDRFWQKSNQYEWFIRCSHCNKLQNLTWEENVDRDKKIFICRHCHKEIFDDDRRVGDWVARYPTKDEWHGYHFSQLMCPWISASRLLDKEQHAQSKQHFYNYSLGETYQTQTKMIGDAEILSMTGDYEEQAAGKACIAGVDQGDVFYVVIGKLEPLESNQWKRRVLTMRACKSKVELIDILNRFNVKLVVMDAMPNRHTAKEVADQFPKKLYLSFYDTGVAKREKDIAIWNRLNGSVLIQRTESLDKLLTSLYDRKWEFPRLALEVRTLIQHFKNININFVNRYGQTVKVFENQGPDHYLHAMNYLNIAFDEAPKVMLLGDMSNPSIRYSSPLLREFPKDISNNPDEDFDRQRSQQGGWTRIEPLR
jgi:hypothetical protein